MSEYSVENDKTSCPLEKLVLPLENEWSIFFDVRQKRGCDINRYENCCSKIGSFNSVKTFWQYWNNFMDLSFPDDSNIRLFKSNIKPMWEDPANVRGGQISLWSAKKDTPRLWLDLVLSVIGEQFEHGYSLCGVVLSKRPERDRITVWVHSNHSKTLVEQMTEQLRVLLNLSHRVDVKYEPHEKNIKPIPFKHSKSTPSISTSLEILSLPVSTPSTPSTLSDNAVEIIEDDNTTVILADLEKTVNHQENTLIQNISSPNSQFSEFNDECTTITPTTDIATTPEPEIPLQPIQLETTPPVTDPKENSENSINSTNSINNCALEEPAPQSSLVVNSATSPIRMYIHSSKNAHSPHILQWLAFITFLCCYSYSYYHLQPIGATGDEQFQVPFISASNDANMSPFISSTVNSHLKSSFASAITSHVASSFAAHMSTVVSQHGNTVA